MSEAPIPRPVSGRRPIPPRPQPRSRGARREGPRAERPQAFAEIRANAWPSCSAGVSRPRGAEHGASRVLHG